MQRKYAEYRKKPDKTPEEQYKEKADMWGRGGGGKWQRTVLNAAE